MSAVLTLSPCGIGQIVAAYSRQYLVELADGTLLPCLSRGKTSEFVCGDTVEVLRTSSNQGVIERALPRLSFLFRSDAYRRKYIAANITQIIIVVATEPPFSDDLLTRCLIAAHEQKLATLIILNKCDLQSATIQARAQLSPYQNAGYRILELSAKDNIEPLRPCLENQTSVLIGQSGMGKSTLINALLPGAQAVTREISSALNSGKHTTTRSHLYHINAHSHLIDCPGVQAFGLHHLNADTIAAGFVEFSPYLGKCRFSNCSHQHEPDCALKMAQQQGKIDARRLRLFQEISQGAF